MRRLLLSVLAIVLAAAVPAAAWTPVGTVQGYLIIANTLTDVQTVHLVDSVALFGGGVPRADAHSRKSVRDLDEQRRGRHPGPNHWLPPDC